MKLKPIINSLLDTDLYKFNMNQVIFHKHTAANGEYHFKSFGHEDIGILEVSMDAHFLINDGQHRKSAILAALKEDPSLGTETISIVFYADKGLLRSQQIL